MLRKFMGKAPLLKAMNPMATRSMLPVAMQTRNFYYPDANHHHLNQEVSAINDHC